MPSDLEGVPPNIFVDLPLQRILSFHLIVWSLHFKFRILFNEFFTNGSIESESWELA